MHRAADVQLDPGLGEFLDDVAGVGQGLGEPVKFRDDQGVAGPARREGLLQPGPSPVGAGQTVVDIDPIRLHAERDQRVALRGEFQAMPADREAVGSCGLVDGCCAAIRRSGLRVEAG